MEKTTTSDKKSISSIIEVGKDALSLIRDLMLFLLVLLLLICPRELNSILTEAGFEEGSFLGFKWKKSLAETATALNEVQKMNSTLAGKLDTLFSLNPNDPKLQAKYNKIKSELKKILEESRQTKVSSDSILSINASMINDALNANSNNRWGIVVSGFSDLYPAQKERSSIKNLTGKEVSIFYRNKSYRNVILLNNREDANKLLDTLKKSKWMDAYIITIPIWCPNQKPRENKTCIECQPL